MSTLERFKESFAGEDFDVSAAFGVRGLPTTVLIDRQGRLVRSDCESERRGVGRAGPTDPRRNEMTR